MVDSGGAPLVCAPLQVQILSFWHTNFSKCSHLRSWCLPYEVGTPLREILDLLLIMILDEEQATNASEALTVSKTIWGDSTVAVCTQFLPNLWPHFHRVRDRFVVHKFPKQWFIPPLTINPQCKLWKVHWLPL